MLTILLKAEGNTSVVRGAGKRGRPAPVLCRDSEAASASGGTEEEGEKIDTFPRTWRSVSQGEVRRASHFGNISI